jgi:15-cis-phytoene synthase
MTLDSSLTQRAMPPGSMRYYAWLFTTAEHRDILAALFVIESELHDSARAAHEVAHVRLQWWREEFDYLLQGKPRHPATMALHAASRDRKFDEESLQLLHLATAQELASATYESDAELSAYFKGGLGSLMQLAAASMSNAPTPTLLDAAAQVGAFIRETETLRDLRYDSHHGRLYLPLNDLSQLGIDYQALQQPVWPNTFSAWLATRCEHILNRYNTQQQSLLATEKQTLRPMLVLAALHGRLLTTIQRNPSVQTKQRVELKPLQKTWTAWRTARAAR